MAPGVSVVIPCYNGVARLRTTLVHLARQRVPDGIAWEVVVVDDASTDGTADLACSVPFRVVAQPIPWTVAARKMGAEASRYDFIFFCGHDNWLDQDYVRLAYDALVDRPGIDVIGGQGTPTFVGEPPPWFHTSARYYALGPQGGTSGDVADGKGSVYGAGMVVRRSAWDALHQRASAACWPAGTAPP